ncbi:MAG: type II secretion system F family protein, partial [Bacilli bacterium]
ANSYIESKLHSAFNEILKGTSFSQALKDANLFRSDFLEMVKVGEQSGELGSMLSTTTAYLDEQVLDNMHKLVALIEPSLIVLIAGLIIIIMSVVFFPLMNIMKYRF